MAELLETNDTQLISMKQMEQVFQMFQKIKTTNTQTENTGPGIRVAEKVKYHNHTKWSKLMHLAIGGRGRLKHIIDEPLPTIDPNYSQWVKEIPWLYHG